MSFSSGRVTVLYWHLLTMLLLVEQGSADSTSCGYFLAGAPSLGGAGKLFTWDTHSNSLILVWRLGWCSVRSPGHAVNPGGSAAAIRGRRRSRSPDTAPAPSGLSAPSVFLSGSFRERLKAGRGVSSRNLHNFREDAARGGAVAWGWAYQQAVLGSPLLFTAVLEPRLVRVRDWHSASLVWSPTGVATMFQPVPLPVTVSTTT